MYEFAPMFGILLFFAYLLVPTWFFASGNLEAIAAEGRGKWSTFNRLVGGQLTLAKLEAKSTEDDVPCFETVAKRVTARKRVLHKLG